MSEQYKVKPSYPTGYDMSKAIYTSVGGRSYADYPHNGESMEAFKARVAAATQRLAQKTADEQGRSIDVRIERRGF